SKKPPVGPPGRGFVLRAPRLGFPKPASRCLLLHGGAFGSPPPASEARGGEGFGVGALSDLDVSTPHPARCCAPRHPPHRSSKSDVSDLDQSIHGRTREHLGSAGGGKRSGRDRCPGAK